MLVMWVVMPQDRPDIMRPMPIDSMQACWQQAQQFVAGGLTAEMREHGAIGLGATCAWREKPGTTGTPG